MKKIFVSLFLAGIVVCHTNAQTAVEGNKFLDNWSIGISAGGTTPLTHYSFFGNLRPITGIELNKQLTPVFGFGLEAVGSFNTSQSRTAFDRSNVSLLGLVNLNNLLGTYTGVPRPFEIEAVAGIGWLHYYMNRRMGSDQNSMSTKLGLNFNFNLGESKAWTLALKPALVYDMNAMGAEAVRFHSKRAVWEISVGLKYHLGCSNGKHYFIKVKPYDQQEVDILNEKINELHSQVGKNTEALEEAARKVTELKTALDKCRNQEPKIVKDTIDNSRKTLESVITFRQGRTTVDNSQLPNVERIATYLKNHKEASVVIKGYASPEGSVEVNDRIARQRAEIVKKMLVNRYGIAEERIVAEGQGVGNMFEEPDWNRVSICTINARTESRNR
ncbi:MULTISPECIES: OmpA family protein [Bacteroides]|uniref:OmpA family protein n=1 Tax=Bacteroides TaxID=816 RepID=UPI00229653CF|nr:MULTISPECIES: OmpA family protein [Bacteroides]MCY6344271.1 OmpA family protein [Bacteroides fragilis]MCZ2672045.1 OmpA family protein [Bacteroides fragilis]MDV6205027.1 OmpA family protein [Bacteroides hominis (ex Liu et al. 2022)]